MNKITKLIFGKDKIIMEETSVVINQWFSLFFPTDLLRLVYIIVETDKGVMPNYNMVLPLGRAQQIAT